MASGTVTISGLKELTLAMRVISPKLKAELQSSLRLIVAEAAKAAVTEAELQGFAPPGRSGRGEGALIGQIRSGVTMTKGYIKDTANREGYYYPARYEYQDAGARSFMRPAIDKNRDKIYLSLAAVVDSVCERFNSGAP